MKKIILFISLVIFLPIIHTLIILKAFNYIYTNTINFTSLNLLPLNYEYILSITKYIFPFCTYFMYVILSFSFFNIFKKNVSKEKTPTKICTNEYMMYIGKNGDTKIYLPKSSLYQNILITGSIGSGKTSSTIYPFLSQLLSLSNTSGLILDVKGNMKDIIYSMKNTHEIICIEIGGKYKYNPLDKPNLKPYMLSDRLVTILKLFSNTKTSDSYWFDKAGQMLTESIKLIRLYNSNYVDFIELHNIVSSPKYITEKINIVKNMFLHNQLNEKMQYDFDSILTYFQNEYISLDSKIQSVILSEISRLTNVFTNDMDISNTFCPKKQEISFTGFENIFSKHQIVLLNIPIGIYQNLSKILATYLKLDYQFETLKREQPISSPSLFISDEYQEYVTENDANYLSLSREYKCINIISTQSYSSLLNTLKDNSLLNIITQSCINKIFLRTDDVFTIEQAQKLFGKEEKIRISNSLSENAQETNYNYLLNMMRSKKSNISQSLSSYTCMDYIFDFKDFSLNLKNFQAICYLSSGTNMLKPFIINLIPYFRKE